MADESAPASLNRPRISRLPLFWVRPGKAGQRGVKSAARRSRVGPLYNRDAPSSLLSFLSNVPRYAKLATSGVFRVTKVGQVMPYLRQAKPEICQGGKALRQVK
jgi:hypothetical protein